MKSFRNFCQRTAGAWKSHRRYFYGKSRQPSNMESDLLVEFTDLDDDKFELSLSWSTNNLDGKHESDGIIRAVCDENVMLRDRGYMSDEPTETMVHMIDIDCVELYTVYNGMSFREEIRLLTPDLRLRQTVGFKEGTNQVLLAGQYMEERVK